MADLTLTALRVLRAVNDVRSFTRAAEALGYTQSAVSKQMSALELATGAVLFRRVPRGVELTTAGQMLASRAVVILNEMDAARREVAELTDAIVGTVVLGAFPTAAMRLVPAVIRQLRLDHPALTVDFDGASSPTQLGRLRAGRLDVAVIALGTGLADYDLTGLHTEVLASGPLVIAVAESHPFATRSRVAVTELETEPWIAGAGARDDPQFGAWPTLVSPLISYMARDWPTRFGFVEAGLGITTIPSIAGRNIPRGIRLVRVDDPSWRGRSAVVATREERSDLVAVVSEAFVRQAALLLADDEIQNRRTDRQDY